jgi:hypothetical protein
LRSLKQMSIDVIGKLKYGFLRDQSCLRRFVYSTDRVLLLHIYINHSNPFDNQYRGMVKYNNRSWLSQPVPAKKKPGTF